jgi:hypothetical protein
MKRKKIQLMSIKDTLWIQRHKEVEIKNMEKYIQPSGYPHLAQDKKSWKPRSSNILIQIHPDQSPSLPLSIF